MNNKTFSIVHVQYVGGRLVIIPDARRERALAAQREAAWQRVRYVMRHGARK